MNDFKIALLQLTACDNLKDAIKKGISSCRKAKMLGADIAVFPEMWSNGYEMLFEGTLEQNRNLPLEKIETWKRKAISESSEFVLTFQRLSKELDMAIAITFFEQNDPLPKNTVAIFDRFGNQVLKYSKVHTVDFKMEHFMEPGDFFPTCDLNYKNGIVKLGAMICWDREFPESARILMLKGAELILVPNACKMTKIRLQQLKVRAYENMVGVITVNYANHSGHSSAYSPIVRDSCHNEIDNEVFVLDEKEQIAIASFDMEKIRDYRRRETLGDAYRKPYAYKEILDEFGNEVFARSDSKRKKVKEIE